MLVFGRPHSNEKVTLRTGEHHGRAEDRTVDCVGSRKGGVMLRPDRGGGRGVPQEEAGRDGKDIQGHRVAAARGV